MNKQVHTYIYLHEGAIHIKDMTVDEYQANFEQLHLLNRWSNIKQNHQMITGVADEIARRSKLQVIDHRSKSS